jgi:hypothetical protein
MQQLMVLEEGFDRRPRANHQAQDTSSQAALGTSQLVARANSGDQGAWEQLVERYGGLVWAVARAHGLDPTHVSEVSQVTWLRLTQTSAPSSSPTGWEAGCCVPPPARPTACAGWAAAVSCPRRRARPGAPQHPGVGRSSSRWRPIQPVQELVRYCGFRRARQNSHVSPAEVATAASAASRLTERLRPRGSGLSP